MGCSLLSDMCFEQSQPCRSPEEAVVHAVLEARRAAPAILFLPHLQLWWETAPASLRATLSMLLSDLPQDLPLLLLATADVPLAELDSDALKLFGSGSMLMPAGKHVDSLISLLEPHIWQTCCTLTHAPTPLQPTQHPLCALLPSLGTSVMSLDLSLCF